MRRSVQLFLALAVAFALGCDMGVGDQLCTEDSIDRDKDDDCPYGAPGGPKVNVNTAVDGCQDLPVFDPPPAVCPSWDEVWARFVAADGGRCSNATCHGDPNNSGFGIYLPLDSAGDSYDALAAWERNGQPYIRDSKEPSAANAFILCNVEGKKGGGAPMPKPNGLTGPKKDTDLKLVRDWVNCGMKKTGGGSGVGGGGGGGGGGEGGLGGLGGAGGVGGL